MATRIARPVTAFPMSHGQKRPRVEAGAHLAFIRQLPSIISGRRPVEAAHIRYGSIPHGKPLSGGQAKPSDQWTVPLTPEEHRAQHAHGEREWWLGMNIDPLVIAALLWAATGDLERGEAICRNARNFPNGEKVYA